MCFFSQHQPYLNSGDKSAIKVEIDVGDERGHSTIDDDLVED